MNDKWSKHPPHKACYAIFRGYRQCGSRAYGENIIEPVEVREVYVGQTKELGVAMTGRQTLFRLEQFSGEWLVLDLGAA